MKPCPQWAGFFVNDKFKTMGYSFSGKLYTDQQEFDFPDDKSGTVALTSDLAGGSYKIYRALLTQSGTDAPVANILQNDGDLSIIWTRISSGIYKGTPSINFNLSKTTANVFWLRGNGDGDASFARNLSLGGISYDYITELAFGTPSEQEGTVEVVILVYP